MPFKKGKPKTGGKPKGYVSKPTELAREAIAKLVDLNAPNMVKWLDDIAQENPKDAFDCMMKVMEYHLPKLNRTDVSLANQPGEAFEIKQTIDTSKLTNEQLEEFLRLTDAATSRSN